MTKRMLIDATHAEETRVVVLDGNRLEDFDVETSTKKQLKGNIYLAKIVRVEPSLQAAFVEYGGGRHGFLAFGEIHPDYYQIPVADRQRLLAMQAEEAREEEEAEEAAERALQAAAHQRHGNADRHRREHVPHAAPVPEPVSDEATVSAAETPAEPFVAEPVAAEMHEPPTHGDVGEGESAHEDVQEDPAPAHAALDHPADHHAEAAHHDTAEPSDGEDSEPESRRPAQAASIAQDVVFGDVEIVDASHPVHVAGGGAESVVETEAENPFDPGQSDLDIPAPDLPPPETIGGETDADDGAAEARARRTSRLLRNYRIQEVIRRRQIMLVQVVKEERGTKGAALTTYISLAGRFCVLMPNSPRGGGISRKITSAADRRRLKEITSELEIPRGMGLIVRTAGANRPKPEIRRDCEYLMRLWDDIREHTMRSVAPALIYEEASLIKRAIRDVYSRDVEEILVDGEQGWRAAHEFMRMLMPSHAKKVQLWRPNVNGGGGQPLFARQNVEAQLDAMMSPTVQLRSGGYLIIAQTEALVSIDVNSGRSTRERGIEETALKTNLEAADEVARQLRLRDLAGLIVIDFIDMESKKNNAAVERRIKEALKNDRARIQVGHISHFGLLEMSRQRLRPSLAESSFVQCMHCGGAGLVRGVESSAIHVLRDIEEEGAKQRASLIMVHCPAPITMFLLNNKRERLAEVEQRFAMRVHFTPDDTLIAPNIRIDRLRPQVPEAERVAFTPVIPAAPAFPVSDTGNASTYDEEEEADDVFEDDGVPAASPAPRAAAPASSAPPSPAPARGPDAADGDRPRRRRRRRRGNRRDQPPSAMPGVQPASGAFSGGDGEPDDETPSADGAPSDGEPHAEGEIIAAHEDAAPAVALGEDGQPLIDPSDFDESGLPVARGPRRGRRGGRRRRRDGGPEGAEIPAGPEAAAPEPAHVGPTPANPFGGDVFDIYDMMDQDHAPPPAPVSPPAAKIVAEAARPAEVPPAPEPAVEEPPVSEPAVHEPPTGEVPVEEPPAPDEPAPVEPHPEPPAGDPPAGDPPVAENVIKPIVIGADPSPVAAPKRGWWRR
jgi:ribonuclease E